MGLALAVVVWLPGGLAGGSSPNRLPRSSLARVRPTATRTAATATRARTQPSRRPSWRRKPRDGVTSGPAGAGGTGSSAPTGALSGPEAERERPAAIAWTVWKRSSGSVAIDWRTIVSRSRDTPARRARGGMVLDGSAPGARPVSISYRQAPRP